MEGEAPLDAAERCLRDARNAGLAACVRSHPIEALIFGVLMPLAIGSYFVGDLVLDVSAYSGSAPHAAHPRPRHRTPLASASAEYARGACSMGPSVLLHPRAHVPSCLLYTSPSPRDATLSRMPSSA